MSVSKKNKELFTKVFERPEICVANLISKFQENQHLKKYKDKEFKLTKEQKKQIKLFWKPYKHISYKWAEYYSAKNGKFDPRYIPNDLYYTKIDQHFNARKLGYGFNDKNYYSKIFDGILQPEIVIRKINGLLFDEQYNMLTVETSKRLITDHDEVICKPSQESGSGRGIEFLKKNEVDRIEKFLTSADYDNYVVQLLLNQHNDMNRIHSDSVNCIRICSLLLDDGVHILSFVLRMGFGSSKVDNATAKDNAKFDGMSCGINQDGCLNKFAFGYNTGKKLNMHPGGVVFEEFKVPSYNKAVELVKKCHTRIGNFRLVSWDIAINSEGNPVLIEANMRKGGINFHQFNNGPLFGELTERVLDEVLKK